MHGLQWHPNITGRPVPHLSDRNACTNVSEPNELQIRRSSPQVVRIGFAITSLLTLNHFVSADLSPKLLPRWLQEWASGATPQEWACLPKEILPLSEAQTLQIRRKLQAP